MNIKHIVAIKVTRRRSWILVHSFICVKKINDVWNSIYLSNLNVFVVRVNDNIIRPGHVEVVLRHTAIVKFLRFYWIEVAGIVNYHRSRLIALCPRRLLNLLVAHSSKCVIKDRLALHCFTILQELSHWTLIEGFIFV